MTIFDESIAAVDGNRNKMLAAVLCAGFLSLVLQFASIGVGCKCWRGSYKSAQLGIATRLDGLVVLRAVVAWLRKEKNPSWLAYSLLCLCSSVWLPLLSESLVRFHDYRTGDHLWAELDHRFGH